MAQDSPRWRRLQRWLTGEETRDQKTASGWTETLRDAMHDDAANERLARLARSLSLNLCMVIVTVGIAAALVLAAARWSGLTGTVPPVSVSGRALAGAVIGVISSVMGWVLYRRRRK